MIATFVVGVIVSALVVVLSESVRPVNLNLLELPVRFGVAFVCFIFGNILGKIAARIGR